MEILHNIGWPILLNGWNESDFSWTKMIYKISDFKITTFFPVTVNVKFDDEDSTKSILSVSQQQ